MKTHYLKLWPLYFTPTAKGLKNFENRKDDRGYAVGDSLVLREWTEEEGYTGRELKRVVTYVLKDGFPGVAPGYVILGLRV